MHAVSRCPRFWPRWRWWIPAPPSPGPLGDRAGAVPGERQARPMGVLGRRGRGRGQRLQQSRKGQRARGKARRVVEADRPRRRPSLARTLPNLPEPPPEPPRTVPSRRRTSPSRPAASARDRSAGRASQVTWCACRRSRRAHNGALRVCAERLPDAGGSRLL